MLSEKPAWNQSYATECDQLAEIEAAKYPRHWGRWYIEDDFLCTRVMSPHVGNQSGGSFEIYDFSLNHCRTEAEGRNQVQHMAEKNWIGEKGLSDLQRAFEDLIKRNIVHEN